MMKAGSLRTRIALGGVWALCMMAISMFLGAAGHGVFAPLGLFTAPVSFLGTQAAWLACAPFAVFLAVVSVHKSFPWIVSIHYVTGAIVLFTTEFSDWKVLSKLPGSFSLVFGIGLLWYLFGHFSLWRMWLRAR